MFNEFYAFLEENNLILHEGTMIDGSFVESPRQHNTREENKIIKEDRGGELWNPEEGDTDCPHPLKRRKNQKTDRTKRILCKFAASYFQILFNGPRMVWRCGAKMVKIEVPFIFAF